MGWQDAPIVEAKAPAWQSAPEVGNAVADVDAALQRGVDRVGRQIGLTARAGVQGLGNVLALPGTLYDAAANAVGAGGPRFRSAEAIADTLTKAGLPEPQNASERISQDVAGAIAGQGGVLKLLNYLAPSGPVATRLLELLRSNQGSQVVGAGTGAGAMAAAREEGAGPGTQMLAGIAGGGIVAPATAATSVATPAVIRGARAAIQPFTNSGREQVVGTTLRRMATDPDAAIANIGAAKEIVPGSLPTTAQAARDEGLLITERGLGSASPRAGAQLARRASDQNAARNALLDEMAKSEADLAKAKGERLGAASPLYKEAMKKGVDPEAAEVLKPQIQNLMERVPTGVMEKAKELARLNGQTMGKEGSIDGLHWMKLAVDDMLDSAPQTGIGKQTKGAITQYKADLLTVMDELSPAYAQARKTYHTMSAPVNQMEELQGVRAKVQNPGTDAATGERLLSSAKFSNLMRNPDSRARLKESLTPEQFKNLETISADLDRASLSHTSGKAAGSNTLQNISTAYVVGQALGAKAANGGVATNMSRPLAWLNKLNEPQIQDLLADAMLDPQLARRLMQSASTSSVDSLAIELRNRAIANGWGSQIGSLVSAQQGPVKRP